MIQNVPIALEHLGLKSLHVDWYRPEEPGKDFRSDLEIGYNIDIEDSVVARVSMIFKDHRKQQEDNIPLFTLEAEMVGFFRTAPDCPPEARQKLLKLNGVHTLYGALRGMLLSMSGCFPPGFRYTLPTVNLQEVVKEVEAKRGRDEAQSPASKIREPKAPPYQIAAKAPAKGKPKKRPPH